MDFFSHLFINQASVACLIAASYLVLWHWAGMLSFGHALLVASGSYTAYAAYWWVTSHYLNALSPSFETGMSPLFWEQILPLLLLASGAAAGALVGALVGLVAGRWSGTPFAMLTLALAELVSHMAMASPEWFGGEGGLAIDRGIYWSQSLRLEWLSMATLGLSLLGLAILGRRHWTLRLRAVQYNPDRYAHMGGSVWAMRLSALVLSGALAGLAGALMLLHLEHTSYQAFAMENSSNYLVYAFLGLVLYQTLLRLGAVRNAPHPLSFFSSSSVSILGASLCAAWLMVLGQSLLSRWTHLWGLVLGLSIMLGIYLSLRPTRPTA